MNNFFIIILTMLSQRLRDDPDLVRESLFRAVAMVNGRDPSMYRGLLPTKFDAYYTQHVAGAEDLGITILGRAARFLTRNIDLGWLSFDGYTFIGIAIFFTAAIPFFMHAWIHFTPEFPFCTGTYWRWFPRLDPFTDLHSGLHQYLSQSPIININNFTGVNMPISLPNAIRNFGQWVPNAYQQMGIQPITPRQPQSQLLMDYILNAYRPLLQELHNIIERNLTLIAIHGPSGGRWLNRMNVYLDSIRNLQNYIRELLDSIGLVDLNWNLFFYYLDLFMGGYY